MTRDRPSHREPILEHALAIVVEQGLSELSLRPLAQRAGVSVALITARFGAKADLMAQVATAAAALDRAFFARWQELLPDPADADTETRAALAELAFQEWVSNGARQAYLLIELVHDSALGAEPPPALGAWLDDAGCFWSQMIFGTAELAELALGYVLDEAGFALAARDNRPYQLLRSLCLRRFAAGILPPAFALPPRPAVDRLIRLLDPGDSPVPNDNDTKRSHIAASAAGIIVSQGMGAVTHRSVALAAQVPPSTVVYHFGARSALVVAGLHAIVGRFRELVETRSSAPGPADGSTVRELIKATSLIAIAAAREPGLVPYALDMRRRRGENITADGAANLGLSSSGSFDRTAAQVLSVALFGLEMVTMARRRPEQKASRQSLTRLLAWRARHPG